MVSALKHKKIGLLGGSFNPAHNGHLGISLSALNTLGLDCVWWLITPQSPHKQKSSYAPLNTRIQHAHEITKDHNNIIIKDMESDLQSTYTVDVIHHITSTHPETQFLWLMGADNMVQFHTWKRWQDIAQMVPLAVFARPNIDSKTLYNCPCYDILNRVPSQDIWTQTPNIWTYIETTHFTECATEIRAEI